MGKLSRIFASEVDKNRAFETPLKYSDSSLHGTPLDDVSSFSPVSAFCLQSPARSQGLGDKGGTPPGSVGVGSVLSPVSAASQHKDKGRGSGFEKSARTISKTKN